MIISVRQYVTGVYGLYSMYTFCGSCSNLLVSDPSFNEIPTDFQWSHILVSLYWWLASIPMRSTMEVISLLCSSFCWNLASILSWRPQSCVIFFLSTVAAISFFPTGDGLFSNNIYWRVSFFWLLVSKHCWWYICTFFAGIDLHSNEVDFGGRTFLCHSVTHWPPISFRVLWRPPQCFLLLTCPFISTFEATSVSFCC